MENFALIQHHTAFVPSCSRHLLALQTFGSLNRSHTGRSHAPWFHSWNASVVSRRIMMLSARRSPVRSAEPHGAREKPCDAAAYNRIIILHMVTQIHMSTSGALEPDSNEQVLGEKRCGLTLRTSLTRGVSNFWAQTPAMQSHGQLRKKCTFFKMRWTLFIWSFALYLH